MADDNRRSALERHYEPGRYGAVVTEVPGVTLAERRDLSMAQVNGAPDASGPPTLGSVTAGDAMLLWTGPGQWFAVSERASAEDLVADLEERLSSSDATVSDLSHARTVVRIGGAWWKDLLAKGCPADIDAMVAGDCIASLLGHFTVIIHCVADDCADVYVFRSFGASLWEWLRGGAEEFGYVVQEPLSP